MHKIKDFLVSPYQVVKNKWGFIIGSYIGSLGTYVVYLLFPFIASKIIALATGGDISGTYLWILFLFLVYATYSVFDFFNYYFYTKYSIHINETLYTKYFHKFLAAKDSFLQNFSKGKIFNTVILDSAKVPWYIDATFEIVSSFIAVLGLVVILFLTDWITALCMFLGLVFYFWYVIKKSEKYERQIEIQKQRNDSVVSVFEEALAGLREIRTLSLFPSLHRKFDTGKKRYLHIAKEKGKTNEKIENTSELWVYIIKLGLYLLLFFSVFYRGFTVDKLILIVGYYDILVENLSILLTSWEGAMEYRVATDRVKTLLRYEDGKTMATGFYEETQIYGEIQFSHVTFRHDSKDILSDVSFAIHPNTVVAIVGASGSGKTLLLYLLMRFVTVKDGDIFLDGRSIYDYRSEIYGNNITLVSQNPFFFHTSIQNNLRYINPHKKEQIDACKRVGIHEFIMSLPQKYRTVLKNNATNLSGGQKQLLSVARSILTDAEILLLDEITSSLDPHTSENIVALLEDLKKDHTVLIVTNRENIMKAADQILWVHDGTVESIDCYEAFLEKGAEVDDYA